MELKQWLNIPAYTRCEAYRLPEPKTKGRFKKLDDRTGFVFSKGCTRRGRYISAEQMLKEFILIEKNEEAAWQKKIQRAKKLITESGLWPNMYIYFTNLEKMTLEDKQKILELYWSIPFMSRKNPVDKINDIHETIFGEYIKKYPFIFPKDENGAMFVDSEYIFEKSDVKLKTMYFGRDNRFIKEQIRSALKNKNAYSTHERTNYDIRFQYDPETNRAWYSEEYLGCGNGHYYIALSENAALFCEND